VKLAAVHADDNIAAGAVVYVAVYNNNNHTLHQREEKGHNLGILPFFLYYILVIFSFMTFRFSQPLVSYQK